MSPDRERWGCRGSFVQQGASSLSPSELFPPPRAGQQQALSRYRRPQLSEVTQQQLLGEESLADVQKWGVSKLTRRRAVAALSELSSCLCLLLCSLQRAPSSLPSLTLCFGVFFLHQCQPDNPLCRSQGSCSPVPVVASSLGRSEVPRGARTLCLVGNVFVLLKSRIMLYQLKI